MVKPFNDRTVGGVQGAYRTRQNGLVPLYEQIYIESNYEYLKFRANIDTVGTYSAAYRKKLFFELGGFNESYLAACGEDFEFSYMVARNGYKIVFNEKAICFHRHPEKFLKYMKVKYWRGYWRALMYKKNVDKIYRDSYTPLYEKIQMITVLLFLSSLPVVLAVQNLYFASIIILITYFFLSLRFSLFAYKRSMKVAILAPFITFFRSVFFIIGAATGITHMLTGKLK